MATEKSQFYTDHRGMTHIVVLYKSGPQTPCGINPHRDDVWEDDTENSGNNISCERCAQEINVE